MFEEIRVFLLHYKLETKKTHFCKTSIAPQSRRGRETPCFVLVTGGW
jgi:hypothetical protein